jgi:hypothetical protein
MSAELVVIGYCDDMTNPNAASRNVGYYIMVAGEVQLAILAEANLEKIPKDILINAAKTCSTLEEVKEIFTAPHSSLFVVGTEIL